MTKYIVALQTGGAMEHPRIEYSHGQLIDAEDPCEAEKIYNEKNDCDYYYGCVIGYVVDDQRHLTVSFKNNILAKIGIKK
jgi:hypothetical protein